MEQEQEYNPVNCVNCGHEISPSDRYCHSCGQKLTSGLVTLRSIIGEFIENTLNLNLRIFPTLRDLLIPGKLTRKYFEGVRGKYFTPARLFFVTAIFLFAALSLYENVLVISDFNTKVILHSQLERMKFSKGYYEGKEKIKPYFQFQQDTAILDSLDTYLPSLMPDSSRMDTIKLDSFTLSDTVVTMEIAFKDLVELDPDSIIRKYEVPGFVNQLIGKQFIKLFQDVESFTKVLLGRFFWSAIILMPFLALLLKLFYLRRKKYYVEHLVFCFHTHAFAFIIAILLLLLGERVNLTIAIIAAGGVGIYTLLAFKNYYQQPWLRTIIKAILIGLCYILLAIIFLIMTMIIGFLIY